MGSEAFPLQSKGIFRSLPTFSPDIKDLTAIVTGCNGISGFHTMRVLLQSPQRWKKVWAISRRPPPEEMTALLSPDERSRVEHVACDFLDPRDIAKQLKQKGVTADVVFFYAYMQPRPSPGAAVWSNAQELSDTNSALLKNFLGALDELAIVPKRFLLQTGAKNYGIHLGPWRTPTVESDPRVTIEPNFYYPQEDALFQYCRDHPETSWNIICPAWIIGAVNNAAINGFRPLAVYAAVQARKGEKMEFPGDLNAWLGVFEHSTAFLTGYLSEWAVLEDKCQNQKFNVSDACPLAHNRLWPELARWYGCAQGSGIPELDESKITTVDSGDAPTPLGYGPSMKARYHWTLTKWAEDPANRRVWEEEIMPEYKLKHNPFEDIEAHFAFGDAVAWGSTVQLSNNKARSLGWTGHVDTLESLHKAYDEYYKMGMLPPLLADAKPLI